MDALAETSELGYAVVDGNRRVAVQLELHGACESGDSCGRLCELNLDVGEGRNVPAPTTIAEMPVSRWAATASIPVSYPA